MVNDPGPEPASVPSAGRPTAAAGGRSRLTIASSGLVIRSPDEVAARLQNIGFALRRETEPPVGADRDLHAVPTTAWKALTPPEAALCRRLSVFAGGFTMEAAAVVGQGVDLGPDDVPRVLSALKTKFVVTGDDRHPAARLRLEEPVRQVAREQLAASARHEWVAPRHAAFYVAAVRAAGDPREGRVWLDRIEADHGNVEAALRWATAAGHTASAMRLASAHVLLCRAGGRHNEARAWLDRVLAMSDRAPAIPRAKALYDTGVVAGLVGESAIASSRLRRSAAVARATGDYAAAARASSYLGSVCMLAYDYRRGLRALDQAVTMARRAGDITVHADAVAAAGRAHVLVGDPDAGARHFAEAVDLARRAGDHRATANGLIGLGWAALLQGRNGEAEPALEEGRIMAEDLAEMAAVASALSLLGELARRQADADTARTRFEDGAIVAWEVGVAYPLGRSLLGLGRVALDEGDIRTAGHRFEDALGVGRHGNAQYLVAPALAGLGEVAATAGRLAEARSLLEEAALVARTCGARADEAAARHALATLDATEEPALTP